MVSATPMGTSAETATTCVDLVRRHAPRLMREQLGTQASREEMRAAIRATVGADAVKVWKVTPEEHAEFRRLRNKGHDLHNIARITGRGYDAVRHYLNDKTP